MFRWRSNKSLQKPELNLAFDDFWNKIPNNAGHTQSQPQWSTVPAVNWKQCGFIFTKKESNELVETESQLCENGNTFIFPSCEFLDSHHSTCRYRAGTYKHCRRRGGMVMQIMMARAEIPVSPPLYLGPESQQGNKRQYVIHDV